MRNLLLICLYFVVSVKEIFTDSENEIKRGVYPFVAILYYQDKSITGASGARFARSAVLVRNEWLISSSLVTNDTQLAFPKKTLIARAGAISLDVNFTLNEDEDEQEREIIKIIRPANFSASPWWYNDITLLKTLLPFNITNAVATTTLSGKPDMDKSCYILVFAKKYTTNSSDEKLLRQLSVELSPPSKENCGAYFRNETMMCATESDENKNVYDANFCDGNSGGPLMCEGDIIGLQTYIGNNCKSPYLYQSLSAWDDFISCAVEEECLSEHCMNVCEVIDKDNMITVTTKKEITKLTTKVSKEILMQQSSKDSTDDDTLKSSEAVKLAAITKIEKPTATTSAKVDITASTTVRSIFAITESDEMATRFNSQTGWPKEKYVEHRKKLGDIEDSDKIERKTNVEAQLDDLKKKSRSAAVGSATGTAALCQSFFLGTTLKIVYYLL